MSIKTGSLVNLYWENVYWEKELEVIYMPCAEGDSWIFKRKDGVEIRTNCFCKMEEISKVEDKPF